MRRILVIFLSCLGGAAPAMADKPSAADVVATVGKVSLTVADVRNELLLMPQQQGPTASAHAREKRALESLIEWELIRAAGHQARILPVRKWRVDSLLTEMARQNKVDDAGLREMLKTSGLTIQAYRAYLRRQLFRFDTVDFLQRRLIEVSPQEVEALYKRRQLTGSLDQNRKRLRKQLQTRKFDKKYQAWLRGLRTAAVIKRYPERLPSAARPDRKSL